MSETRTLPKGQFDGQIFIDFARMKWVFDESINCWKRDGQVDNIPVANSTTTGLLSKELKYLLDKIPTKGGGYGIITRPKLQFRSQSNPDGVLFGDIELISDTLEIKCVHGDGAEIGTECTKVCYSETDLQPPGFDINFSDLFLRTFCVEIPGGPGLAGPPGVAGEDGKDGTGDGPKGLTGENGKDVSTAHQLTGVKVVDVDNITDMAIVKMELDQEAGKFYITKGKVKVPDDEDISAKQLVASQINRGLNWVDDCWRYQLIILPCGPADDFDLLDPTIAYFPSHFDPENLDPEVPLQPVKKKLRDLIDDVTALYQEKLEEAAEKYDQEIEKYIAEKDKEARMVLDVLGDRLAECENITYLEYCIGIKGKCIEDDPSDPTGPIIELPANSPDCAAVAEAVGAPGSSCHPLSILTVIGKYAPVFAFEKPDSFKWSEGLPSNCNDQPVPEPDEGEELYCPRGCYVRRGRMTQWIQKGGTVPAGWTPVPDPSGGPGQQMPEVATRPSTYGNGDIGGGDGGLAPPAGNSQSQNDQMVTDMQNRLSQGIVLYKKQQFLYSAVSNEFPAGLYAFVYLSGAFRQDRYPGGSEKWIQGPFQQFWVGNQGGGAVGPYYVENLTADSTSQFNSQLATSEIGLEIGFAPTDYVDPLGDDYFDTHAYNPSQERQEANWENLPFDRNDFVGLDSSQKAMEGKILWKGFPAVNSANFDDKNSVENAYLSGFVQSRVVTFKTTQAGLFFARVKVAYSATNFAGQLYMPPIEDSPDDIPRSFTWANIRLVTPRGSEAPPSVDTQFDLGRFGSPMHNAKPIATGEVGIQIVKIDDPPAAEQTTFVGASPTALGTGLTTT